MQAGGPDFIVPGASKSGTTSLYYYLDEHDDIALPEGKELHFFERDEEYDRGLDTYESMFPSVDDGRVTGDITPAYFHRGILYERASHSAYYWNPDDDVPSRIAKAYPDVKLLFSLRNPVTRAYSQYQKNYRQGRERADSFEEAIRAELYGRREKTSDPSCWVFRNRYPVHVGRWLECFDRDQMAFLVFERWIEDPERALNEICDFLGIPGREAWERSDEEKNVGGEPRFVTLNRIYQDYVDGTPIGRLLQRYRITHVVDSLNSREGYPEMSDAARELLAAEFEPEFDELEEMIDVDLDVWRAELPS